MTNYHENPALGAGDLFAISQCPAKWRYGEQPETAAMREGTAAHAALLEPSEFEARYYRIPAATDYEPKALETVNEIKAWLTEAGIKAPSGALKAEIGAIAAQAGAKVLDIEIEALAASESREGLDSALYARCRAMAESVWRQPALAALLRGCEIEQEHYCKIGDLDCKGKIDAYHAETRTLIDYKTTSDASPRAFGQSAAKYGYMLKMAHYTRILAASGKRVNRVILLAQEKTAPYIAVAYEFTPEQLEAGLYAHDVALQMAEQCQKSGVWPAYGDSVQPLQAPDWAL